MVKINFDANKNLNINKIVNINSDSEIKKSFLYFTNYCFFFSTNF